MKPKSRKGTTLQIDKVQLSSNNPDILVPEIIEFFNAKHSFRIKDEMLIFV
jgi:hypothetical protein